MSVKVVCDACGEPSEHTVGINLQAFPQFAPKPYNPYDEEEPQGWIPMEQFAFDFCGKEECFQGLAAEQKLKIDTFAKKFKKGV